MRRFWMWARGTASVDGGGMEIRTARSVKRLATRFETWPSDERSAVLFGLVLFVEFDQVGHEFVFVGQAAEVEADHFVSP